MCLGVLPECMNALSVYIAFGGQQRASDLLGLELPSIVSCHVGSRTQTWLLWKNSQYSYTLSHLSKHLPCFFFFLIHFYFFKHGCPSTFCVDQGGGGLKFETILTF